jgi:predicted TIM-barrel fold metal-dependent hydrolase
MASAQGQDQRSEFVASEKVRAIRESIDHPIIDADGHFLEFLPMVYEHLRDLAGDGAVDHLLARNFVDGLPGYLPARAYWTLPAKNTLDRMTAMLPHLLSQRLDEFGIDYAVLYPTRGLPIPGIVEDEVRRAACRAFNTYAAEAFRDYSQRMSPVALIPVFTPEEAIEELEYAVGLGLSSIVMNGIVPRRREVRGETVTWIDTLGHGSPYDYDPLWQRCMDLGVSPSFHGIGYAWGTRASATNYVYNHLGNFASAQESVCRSLFMGGVPKRFPGLHFQFLEGGVAWAAQLFADIVGHYEKRNGDAVRKFNPAEVDRTLATELFDLHASDRFASRRELFVGELDKWAADREQDTDDFAESGVGGVEDIVEIFSRQFSFGCEADDPLNALAFDDKVLSDGVVLNALFASDIGHWDVPDMSEVLLEARELVDDDLIDDDQFRRFTFENVARALTMNKPDRFAGTVVEDAVASVVVQSGAH